MREANDSVRTGSCPARPGEVCDLGPAKHFPDRSGKIGEVGVLRCRHCGIGVTIPPLEDVSFLYEGRESQDFQPLSTGLARTIKSVAFHWEARRLLKQVRRKPGRVLDFGCGSGLFTRCLGDLLPPGSVVGSDFHPEPPPELADRPYLSNDQVWAQQGSFDLILAMHVIEHDDDPIGLLKRIKGLGSSRCIYVFEVPNVDCVWMPVFGRHWDAWYLPFHRTHFSRASLKGILERAGFKIIHEVDATIPSLGRSIANALGAQNTLPFLLFGVALHPVQLGAELLSRRPSALRAIVRSSA